MTTKGPNKWRDGGQFTKKTYITESWPIYRFFYDLAKEPKVESLIFDFWVYNGTIHKRELQDSHVILHINLI